MISAIGKENFQLVEKKKKRVYKQSAKMSLYTSMAVQRGINTSGNKHFI